MEDIAMGSSSSLSLTDEAKEKASLKVGHPNTTNATPARTEGERSSVNPEDIKRKARSKSESDLECNFWDPRKRSTVTRVINHKRKLSDGEEEVTSEKKSKKLNLLIEKNEVDQSIGAENDVVRASEVELNYPPVNEGAGKEVADGEHPYFKDNNLVFTLDETDSEPSSMEENDDAPNGRILQFDLNELPPTPSDEDAGDST